MSGIPNKIHPDMLSSLARRIRGQIIELSHDSDAMHLGSCLSCIDILIYLYSSFLSVNPEDPDWPDRDRFILSKGHASLALYTVLAHQGFFPGNLLESFNREGSLLTEHPVRGNLPGVEISTGSLGHGAGIGLGISLAGKIMKKNFRTVVLMSDGECNEGTVWEAALLAPVHNLKNLICIIDNNGWQATDRCRDVMALLPLAEKFASFGWNTCEVDGHDFTALDSLFRTISSDTDIDKPTAVIAHTVKGKGITFMEDDNNWHYRVPSADDVRRAKEELGLA